MCHDLESFRGQDGRGGQEVQNRRQKAKKKQCMDDAGEGSYRWREDRGGKSSWEHGTMGASLLGTL